MEYDLSVIIPCLNEEATIGIVVQKSIVTMEKLKINGEIIVVDNGSTDCSTKIAEKNGANIIYCDKKGYGQALKKGFLIAKGNYILMLDADNTYNALEIEWFYKRIIKSKADLIIGSRYKGKIEKDAMPAMNKLIGTPFLTVLINLLYGTNISDCNCGMRIFKKSSLEKIKLNSSGMEIASEMIIKFKKRNFKIKEIPCSLSKSADGRKSHLIPIVDGFRHLFIILCNG